MKRPAAKTLRVEPVSWRPMLASVPHRNAAAQVTANPDGTAVVTIKLNRPGWLVPPLSWVIKPAPVRNVALDAMGAAMWNECDGRRTVEEIVEMFASKHELTFHEARVAVSGFMKSLVARGVLAMARKP